MKSIIRPIVLFLILIPFGLQSQSPPTQPIERISDFPFIENRGQWNREARYLCQTPGLNVWIANDGITFDYYEIYRGEEGGDRHVSRELDPFDQITSSRRRGHVVKMRVEGGIWTGNAEGLLSPAIGRVGADYSWINESGEVIQSRGVHRTRIANIGPGVDMVIYLDGGNPRYDLVVAEGGDPSTLQLSFEGVSDLQISGKDRLKMMTTLGERWQEGLLAYQMIDGIRQKVDCSFRLVGEGKIGFRLGEYDRSRPLIIDPVITGSYVGGSGVESSSASRDLGFGGVLTLSRSIDDGKTLLNGGTSSTDFPVTSGAYDQSLSGSVDGFVAILDGATGDLLRATFIGGSNVDFVSDADEASDGSLWIIGSTLSTNFPVTTDGFQTTYGTADTRGRGFVAHLNGTLSGLDYGSYINGGSGFRTLGQSLRVDGNRVWFVGSTSGSTLPTTSDAFAPDSRFDGSEFPGFTIDNIFFGYIDDDERTLDYLSYINVPALSEGSDSKKMKGHQPLAGNGIENAQGAVGAFATFPLISVNRNGTVAVTATHFSGDMPLTSDAWQPTRFTAQSDRGGWVGTFSAGGTVLEYGTYFGSPTSSSTTEPEGILLEDNGAVSVCGIQNGTTWETTEGAFQRESKGGFDAFLFHIDSENEIDFSTLIGGNGIEIAQAAPIRDQCGRFVLGLRTSSSDFPVTTNAFKQNAEGTDGVALVLSPDGDSLIYSTRVGGSGTDQNPFLSVLENGLISGFMQTTTPGMLVTSDEDGQTTLAGGADFYYFQIFPDEIYVSIPETLRVDCANRDLPVFWNGGRASVGCSPGYGVIVGLLGSNGSFAPLDTVSSLDQSWKGGLPSNVLPGSYRVVIRHATLDFAFDTSGTFDVEVTGGGGGITEFAFAGGGSGTTILCPDQGTETLWTFDERSRPCLLEKKVRFELQDTNGIAVAELGTSLLTEKRFSVSIPKSIDVGVYRVAAFDAETGGFLGQTTNLQLSQGDLVNDMIGSPLRSIAFGRVAARDFRDTTVLLVNRSATCPLVIDGKSVVFESGDIAPNQEFRLLEVLPNTPRDAATNNWVLSPGTSDSIRVRFQPVRGGSRRATMRIATDRRTTEIPGITERGTFYWDFFGSGAVGIEVVGQNNQPSPLQFDPIVIGGEADEERLVLENTSSGQLTVTTIEFDDARFGLAASPGNQLPLVIEAGKLASLILTHSASAGTTPGTKRGKVTLRISTGEKLIAELVGIAGKRELSAHPSQLNLKGKLGEVVRSTVVLSNTGTLPVAISSIGLQNGSREIQLRLSGRSVIEPGGFEFVEVTWVSTGVSIDETIVVESNRIGGPLLIPINGVIGATNLPVSIDR